MIVFLKNYRSELFSIALIAIVFFADDWVDTDVLIIAAISIQLMYVIIKRIRYNQKEQDTIFYFSAKKNFFNTARANLIQGLFFISVVVGILIYMYASGIDDISWDYAKYIMLAFAFGCSYIVTKDGTDYIEVKHSVLDYEITSYKNTFSTEKIATILVTEEKIKFSLKNGENHYVLHQEFDVETKQKIFEFLKSKLKAVDLEVT